MRVTRIAEKNDIRIYRRDRGQEKWVPLYFAYNTKTGEEVKEFKTITQARKFLQPASLLEAIQTKNDNAVADMVKKAKAGDIIRIM